LVSARLPPGMYYGKPPEPKKDGAGGPSEIEGAYIVDSQMVSGRLVGKDVGAGESGNLVHTMVQDCGEEIAVAWLSGFQRVLNHFLMQFGATMGPADYDMPAQIKHECVD